MFTARDRTYMRILQLLESGEKLPVDLRGQFIYHCGPIVRKNMHGYQVISAGPTTSSRMDDVQVKFVQSTGIRGLIGKGRIDKKVAKQISRLGCIYLTFTGGAGALAASMVEGVEEVIWEELGPEAMWVLRVKQFGPLLVTLDLRGKGLRVL